MYRNFVLLLCMEIVACTISAQPIGFHGLKDEPMFRKEISEAAARTNTIEADFSQVKNLKVLSEKISSRGKFWFKKQNRVRMEYTSPYKYLMVINKDKMTIRDETKTTTLSSRSNKLLEYVNRIIVDCVQGTAIDSKDFSVKVLESDKQYLLMMSPSQKDMKEFFSDIHLYIDKVDYSVHRMEMNEPNGDSTILTFVNRKLNEDIPDRLFSVQ